MLEIAYVSECQQLVNKSYSPVGLLNKSNNQFLVFLIFLS